MRKTVVGILAALLVLLSACSGSDGNEERVYDAMYAELQTVYKRNAAYLASVGGIPEGTPAEEILKKVDIKISGDNKSFLLTVSGKVANEGIYEYILETADIIGDVSGGDVTLSAPNRINSWSEQKEAGKEAQISRQQYNNSNLSTVLLTVLTRVCEAYGLEI